MSVDAASGSGASGAGDAPAGAGASAGQGGAGAAGSGDEVAGRGTTAGSRGEVAGRGTSTASNAGAGAMAGGRAPATSGGGGQAAGASGMPGAAAGGGGSGSPTSCTRDFLRASIEGYFAALEKRDASSLALATPVKFTENGMTVQVGDGLWKTAGAAKFKRSALDTQTCSTVTESVVTEGSTDIVVGLRLKLVEQKISEIESIVVRRGDYASNPMSLLGTASDDWESVLPEAQRASREQLSMFVDRYFTAFPAGGCMFAPECQRFENGFTPGSCSIGLSCSESGMSRTGMKTRLMVIDVEASIAVGFTMFQGQYTDFHMFKVRGGQVRALHAVLAKASGPGW